jgi:hypothetical protein
VIEDFSAGYYRIMLDVQERDGKPTIARDLYRVIEEVVYHDSMSPVRMRVGLGPGESFSVKSENGMPADVLTLPESRIKSTGVSNVYIVKPRYNHG